MLFHQFFSVLKLIVTVEDDLGSLIHVGLQAQDEKKGKDD
jgi:hypothetical protein